MKRIFIPILLAGAMLAGSANAQTKTADERWILVDASVDWKYAVQVDSQTMRRDGDTVLVWEKFSLPDGAFALMREQIRRDRVSRTLTSITYDAQGNVVRSSRAPMQWQEPIPGSLQDSVNAGFSRWMAMTATKEAPTPQRY